MALSLCRGEEERGERTVTSAICGIHVSANIPYSGKLSREKTFANFAVLWQFVKVFSMKFGAWCSLVRPKRACMKVFSAKIVFFTNSRKFSPSKVSCYTVSWQACKRHWICYTLVPCGYLTTMHEVRWQRTHHDTLLYTLQHVFPANPLQYSTAENVSA